MALGLTETASTFFWMEPEVDSGPILSQCKVAIGKLDTAATLYARLIEVAKEQLSFFTSELAEGRSFRMKQDIALATSWRKRGQRDGKIDWRMTAEAISCLVRALGPPYVGAHCEFRGHEAKVWKVEKGPGAPPDTEPGKVISVAGSCIVVKCWAGTVRLLSHELSPSPKPGDYL
jgi:methionyl-tRNA formyltransferase